MDPGRKSLHVLKIEFCITPLVICCISTLFMLSNVVFIIVSITVLWYRTDIAYCMLVKAGLVILNLTLEFFVLSVACTPEAEE